jgi:signal transduction histidine kinase
MRRNWLDRRGAMSIRTRLLWLILLFVAAVSGNLFALLFLAHSMSDSLETIERVRTRQLLAVQMRQELGNAEAALYRYQLEGATGFADQFRFEITSFAKNVEKYRTLAMTSDEQNWANELEQVSQDVSGIGRDLITLHDRQLTALQQLLATQTQVSRLIANDLKPPRAQDAAAQHRLDLLDENSQDLVFSVTTYLTAPSDATRAQFTQAAAQLEQNSAALRALPATALEQSGTAQMDAALAEIEKLGAQLLSDRDQQQLSFTRFSAEIFEAGQLVLVEQIQPLEDQRLADAQQDLQRAVLTTLGISFGVPLALTLLAAFLVLRLAHGMDQNILALLRGADRVAAGNLTQAVQVHTEDEFKQLATAFNQMMGDLAARERGLQARLAELQTLRELSLQITRTLDLNQVLSRIASSALQLVQASSVQIFTRAETDGALRLAARAGTDLDHAATATASFPLNLGLQSLGVLTVISDTRQMFSPEDTRILHLLADQAAIALGNARLYHDLAEREERVRALMQRMAQIQDEERRLIGLDLHDGLTQLILSAYMHLNALHAQLTASTDARTRAELAQSRALLKRAIDEARRVIAELRPTVVEEFGLAEGLRRYASEVAEAEGWTCETEIDVDGMDLSTPAQAAIFRIAQEALSNARKYAETRRIRVVLRTDQTQLLLAVRDWGRGFNPDAPVPEADRIGLVGMKERAHMLGGACEISSQPGQGTTVTVRVPLAALQSSPYE